MCKWERRNLQKGRARKKMIIVDDRYQIQKKMPVPFPRAGKVKK